MFPALRIASLNVRTMMLGFSDNLQQFNGIHTQISYHWCCTQKNQCGHCNFSRNKACWWVICSRKTVHLLLRKTVRAKKRHDCTAWVCSKDISPSCDKNPLLKGPKDCYFCGWARTQSILLCSNAYCLSWCERLDLQPTRLTHWRVTIAEDLYLLEGYNVRVGAAQNCSTLE